MWDYGDGKPAHIQDLTVASACSKIRVIHRRYKHHWVGGHLNWHISPGFSSARDCGEGSHRCLSAFFLMFMRGIAVVLSQSRKLLPAPPFHYYNSFPVPRNPPKKYVYCSISCPRQHTPKREPFVLTHVHFWKTQSSFSPFTKKSRGEMEALQYNPRWASANPSGPPIQGFRKGLQSLWRFMQYNPIYTGVWHMEERHKEGLCYIGDIAACDSYYPVTA